jgi:hypothetical protein
MVHGWPSGSCSIRWRPKLCHRTLPRIALPTQMLISALWEVSPTTAGFTGFLGDIGQGTAQRYSSEFSILYTPTPYSALTYTTALFLPQKMWLHHFCIHFQARGENTTTQGHRSRLPQPPRPLAGFDPGKLADGQRPRLADLQTCTRSFWNQDTSVLQRELILDTLGRSLPARMTRRACHSKAKNYSKPRELLQILHRQALFWSTTQGGVPSQRMATCRAWSHGTYSSHQQSLSASGFVERSAGQ